MKYLYLEVMLFNRGIDAPEGKMPYGQEAKEELANIIQDKCLIVQVFDQDRYGRYVGDIYCNGVFVQVHCFRDICIHE